MSDEENKNDDFLEKLADPATDEVEVKRVVKVAPAPKTFDESMKENQAKPIKNKYSLETKNTRPEPRPEPRPDEIVPETKPVKVTASAPIPKDKTNEVEHNPTVKKYVQQKPEPQTVEGNKHSTKNKKTVEVVDSKEYENAGKKQDDNTISHDLDFDDNMKEKLKKINKEKLKNNGNDDEIFAEDDTVESYLQKTYENSQDDDDDSSDNIVETTLVNSVKEENVEPIDKEQPVKKPVTSVKELYGGGNTKDVCFKNRSSKISKTLRKISVSDTSKIDPTNLSNKSFTEQQNLYLKTVVPALKPCYSVTPLLLSGVIITMTAFTWPDIVSICRLEEKVDDLDPKDEDYIYEKNKIFLEKRRKQLSLFYNHIYSISGYPEVPDEDTLYRNIIKFPDFQQLFFAAYAASFQKPHEFTITCGTCGADQSRFVLAKNLCFLLNKHINVNSLVHLVETGASIANDTDSQKVYKEFQENEFVKNVNKVYRSKKPLSTTAIVFEIKIPTIYDAYDTLDELVEKFRDKSLEITTKDGDTIAIDSTYNLPNDILEMRRYMYINSVLVPDPVSTFSDDGVEHVKVGYNRFDDADSIINTVLNLGMSDYKEFMQDSNLHKMVDLMTIQHAINVGTCEKKSCDADMGVLPVEPEMLFFITAGPDLPD